MESRYAEFGKQRMELYESAVKPQLLPDFVAPRGFLEEKDAYALVFRGTKVTIKSNHIHFDSYLRLYSECNPNEVLERVQVYPTHVVSMVFPDISSDDLMTAYQIHDIDSTAGTHEDNKVYVHTWATIPRKLDKIGKSEIDRIFKEALKFDATHEYLMKKVLNGMELKPEMPEK